MPTDLHLREDGRHKGGASAMVSIVLSFRGDGTLRVAPAKTKINAAQCREIVENTYLPDCHELYRVPPTCIFQKDGASSHTANAIEARSSKDECPNFWSKAE